MKLVDCGFVSGDCVEVLTVSGFALSMSLLDIILDTLSGVCDIMFCVMNTVPTSVVDPSCVGLRETFRLPLLSSIKRVDFASTGMSVVDVILRVLPALGVIDSIILNDTICGPIGGCSETVGVWFGMFGVVAVGNGC